VSFTGAGRWSGITGEANFINEGSVALQSGRPPTQVFLISCLIRPSPEAQVARFPALDNLLVPP